ncbi:MAG: nuclear transport factor 2 family protein [Xanthomonadales bacterium]|nr:nuclear transport factor 2 family protein [Xanthomonadales bacterium]
MRCVLKALLIAAALVNANLAMAADDTAELARMLNEFLAGASVDDAAAHDRFWAADLIYTSSSGERIGKADIMGGLSAPAPETVDAADNVEAATVYTAEDIRIQQYGDTAIVAFKLVGTTSRAGENTAAPAEVLYYYNTGTFLRRDGMWQAVAWQATRIPAAP